MNKRITDDQALFACVFAAIGWAVLVSSDSMRDVIPYGTVLGTFDFLRTVATVGTGIIAFLAYRKWRRPDDAKRRADVAQILLRLSQKLQINVLEARKHGMSVHFDNTPFLLEDKIEAAELVLRTVNKKALKKAKREVDELHTYRVEVGKLFAEVGGQRLLDRVEEQCREVMNTFTTLKFGLRPINRRVAGDEVYERWLDKSLAACASC